jgi:hypothetical protein
MTDRVAVPPLLIVEDAGEVVMAGGIRMLTVAAVEFAVPAALLAFTQ